MTALILFIILCVIAPPVGLFVGIVLGIVWALLALSEFRDAYRSGAASIAERHDDPPPWL